MNIHDKMHVPPGGLDIKTFMEALFYRDEFLSIAGHEFKTLLTTIKLQTQVFKRNTKRNDQDRVAQVLLILQNNASKYGSGLPMDFTLFKKNKVSLLVKNQGQEISEKDQKRIFHRCQRALPASIVSGLGKGSILCVEFKQEMSK